MKDKKEIESLKARQAELAREQQRLAERIDRLEKPFTPGWYMATQGDRSIYFYYLDDEYGYNTGTKLHGKLSKVPQYVLDVILPQNTRYNWPEIIKKYPEAQWASTDADGRIDAWDRKPKGGYGDEDGRWVGCGCKSNGDGGHKHVGHTKDWTDSLEKRPDNL